MCGISAAFAYRGGGVDPDALRRTCDRMAARGPDGEGVWTSDDGRVALGHRRLAIIDLSEGGRQPMASDDGRLVIVFNGEIYNYRALKAELEARGHRFRSTSDTEVLLHLYQEKGEAMVDSLRGMFAFALWDAGRRGLLLARDPCGIKPLYLADDGRQIRAASQVKALLAGGGVDTRAEPAGHVGFFLWGHVPEPYTLYRGVRALPAGTTLWVDAEGRRERRFADLTEALAEAEAEAAAGRAANGQAANGKSADAPEAIRAALLDSVRHHLVADVPVGVFLSAGRDSTTLAGLAAEAGGRLRTVTLGFEEYRGTADDEVPLAEAVAAHYGAEHQTCWVTRADFEQEADWLLDAMDQPSIDGVNSYFVSRAAARSGLKVALSGLGGDELFGGYPSFREIPRLVGALGRVPAAEALGRGLRVVTAPLLSRLTSPKYAGLLEYGSDYGGAYLLRRGLHMPWELPALLDPDLVRAGWAELQPRARLEATVAGLANERARVTALESAWYMRNQLLRDTDWASMAHSLEVRTPLVDWALVRALAPLLIAHPELGKGAMAASPRPPLPAAVLDRPKTGFAVPVRTWLLAGRAEPPRERGLRGWSRFVYDAYATGTPARAAVTEPALAAAPNGR